MNRSTQHGAPMGAESRCGTAGSFTRTDFVRLAASTVERRGNSSVFDRKLALRNCRSLLVRSQSWLPSSITSSTSEGIRPASVRAWPADRSARVPTCPDWTRRRPALAPHRGAAVLGHHRARPARGSRSRRGGQARATRRLRGSPRPVRNRHRGAHRRAHDHPGRHRGVDLGRRPQRRTSCAAARPTRPSSTGSTPSSWSVTRPESTVTSLPTASTRRSRSCTATCRRGGRSRPTARARWSRRPIRSGVDAGVRPLRRHRTRQREALRHGLARRRRRARVTPVVHGAAGARRARLVAVGTRTRFGARVDGDRDAFTRFEQIVSRGVD